MDQPGTAAVSDTKIPAHAKASPNRGWRLIGEKTIYARSKWEANYARYLQWQKDRFEIRDWEHEPQTFWFTKIKRGTVSYLPDFKVTRLSGTHFWVEVKGYMDSKSKTKISRFQRYFPEEALLVLDGKWFRQNNTKLSLIVPDWER